jgi:hypothetical protein
MSSTATPYGLVPVNLLGGRAFSGGTIREFKQITNAAAGIFNGDIVVRYTTAIVSNTSADVLKAGTATPTVPATTSTSNGTNAPIGVCVGVRYVDPVLKQTLFSNYLPAGAVTAGYTNIFVRVVDDPFQLYMIQGDGPIYTSMIGYNTTLTGFSSQSTLTGKSAVTLGSAAVANTPTLGMRIIDIVNSDSVFGGGLMVPGDAYTDCIAMFNFGCHVYLQSYGNCGQ